MAENINSYKWICLSITNNGLFTAYLKSDNMVISETWLYQWQAS